VADHRSAFTGSVKGPVDIDTHVPHASRIYDYLLDGTNNFAIDREMAQRLGDAFFGGIDNARADARANRAFLGRAVRYLAGEVGIRQFLDIGTGIPNEDNVHAVAQQVAPDARIVYVDYDMMVQAYARLLLESTPEGATVYLTADLRDPEKILQQAATILDFTKPVALMLVAVLHFIPDGDDPYEVVARLLAAVPSGSYLAVSHLASDVNADEMAEMVTRLNEATRETFVVRSRAEVSRFFSGLEPVEPGLAQVDQWRPPEPQPNQPGQRLTPIYGVVARKP
jgi:hypothetical protein